MTVARSSFAGFGWFKRRVFVDREPLDSAALGNWKSEHSSSNMDRKPNRGPMKSTDYPFDWGLSECPC